MGTTSSSGTAVVAAQARKALGNGGLDLYPHGRRVQENTSMRSREFPREQPEGTLKIAFWYFPVLPDLSKDYPIPNSDVFHST